MASELREIVAEYENDLYERGEQSQLPSRYYLVSSADALANGRKKMYERTTEGDFALPIMRSALETIIANSPGLAGRCNTLLADLNGELTKPLEPTEEELNPPAPPKREYLIEAGDIVHVGAQEYEVVFVGADSFVIQDVRFPLLQTEYSRDEFLRMVAENPLNDEYLQIVDDP